MIFRRRKRCRSRRFSAFSLICSTALMTQWTRNKWICHRKFFRTTSTWHLAWMEALKRRDERSVKRGYTVARSDVKFIKMSNSCWNVRVCAIQSREICARADCESKPRENAEAVRIDLSERFYSAEFVCSPNWHLRSTARRRCLRLQEVQINLDMCNATVACALDERARENEMSREKSREYPRRRGIVSESKCVCADSDRSAERNSKVRFLSLFPLRVRLTDAEATLNYTDVHLERLSSCMSRLNVFGGVRGESAPTFDCCDRSERFKRTKSE